MFHNFFKQLPCRRLVLVCTREGGHPPTSAVGVGHRNHPSTMMCCYTSRAHPVPATEYPLGIALDAIMKDHRERTNRRRRRMKNISKRKSIPFVTPDPIDESVEMAINLNLDPRKPGQNLRGNIALPNGSGKTISCVVFTSDDSLKELALQHGASQAGGESLIDDIVAGVIPVDRFQRALATKEIMPLVTKKAARLLGPRGLMPSAKLGTILSDPSEAKDSLVEVLSTVVAGKEVTYRTDKEGILHIPVGKISFGIDKIIQNIGKVMQTVFDVKPDTFGKGRKGKSSSKAVGKGTKYMLRAYVATTQGSSRRISLRTIDPTSTFFLTNGIEIEKETSRDTTSSSSDATTTAMSASNLPPQQQLDTPTS